MGEQPSEFPTRESSEADANQTEASSRATASGGAARAWMMRNRVEVQRPNDRSERVHLKTNAPSVNDGPPER